MKKILITGRIDVLGKHSEKRDNIDLRFIKMIEEMKSVPIILPNFFISHKRICEINTTKSYCPLFGWRYL